MKAKILKPLNKLKRVIMKKVTGNIGNSHLNRASKNTETLDVKRVLICRPNQRLGNLLLITPLVQEVVATFPNCKIDIVVKGNMAVQVFENFTNVDRLIILPRKPFKELFRYIKVWFSVRSKKYCLVINAVKDSSSGKLLTKLADSDYKVFDELPGESNIQFEDSAHIAKNGIYNLRDYLKLIGHKKDPIRVMQKICLKLSNAEKAKGKSLLEDIVDTKKKTISIFTFATGRKCYDTVWWSTFYDRLKKEYPDYNILEILPIENVSQINFQAPTFYSKDIREIASVIENTALFIGADSGIMHLAAATLTPTLGLFSVTDLKKYGPFGGKNQPIDTNTNDLDDWMGQINAALY